MKYSFPEFVAHKKAGGTKSVQIISGSMLPWIGVNETISVECCQPVDLKPMDIIVFWIKDIYICHIYLKTENNHLVTIGLNNKDFDKPTHVNFLLGKVVDPKFGFIRTLLLKLKFRKML